MSEDIKGVFIVKRDDGVCVFSKLLDGLAENDIKDDSSDQVDKYTIISGLISAISGIVTHISDDYIKRMKLEGESRIKIVIESGGKIAVAVIADKRCSDRKTFGLAKNLVKQFNYLYGDTVEKWGGNTNTFKVFNKIVDTEVGKKGDFTEYMY